MRTLITGATGFAGSHLVDMLLSEGHQVFGFVHPASSHQPWPKHERFLPVEGDLLDLQSLNEAFELAKPAQVFHLGGQASPGRSWLDPAGTLAINTGGTANLLHAAQSFGRPKVLIVTSAHIYGKIHAEDLPLSEVTPPAPEHPYGVSKLAAALLAPVYWRRYGLPVIEARPFNHIGPRQTPGFVVPDFASQVAAVKLRQSKAEIRVGNLDVERDFTDVRDVARAYHLLAKSGQPGHSYLVCSGTAVSIRLILDTLIELADCPVTIVTDPDRMRPAENPRIVGSYQKLQNETGWKPTISLRQSLDDTLADWLERRSA
ncbi:MAG: GDP-mannose 4,6-dehydratase [Chloroflexota bacterium]|nr:MAG: GDP-mannose 4,6-dehydratase [Chloroflexota bacterium]